MAQVSVLIYRRREKEILHPAEINNDSVTLCNWLMEGHIETDNKSCCHIMYKIMNIYKYTYKSQKIL